jgi:hypothetical protein
VGKVDEMCHVTRQARDSWIERATQTIDMTQIDTTTGFAWFTTSFSRLLGTDGVTYHQVTSYISTVDSSCSATYITKIYDIRLGVNTYPLIYANNSYTLDSLESSETLVAAPFSRSIFFSFYHLPRSVREVFH